MDSYTNLCTFWSTGQYYDSTYQICRNCDGKWNGLCLGQSSWFACISPNILDLESMACISTCPSNKARITSSQYTIGTICREPNFYIDPSSSQIVELGTKPYPYKTFRAMASDLLNNFSHKNLNININVKENVQLYLSDNTNFVMNITSVKLTSYSDNSLSVGRATLVPTQISLPATSLRTTFHILANMDLNLNQTISAGTFSISEIDNINSNPSTFVVARSNFYIDNVDFKREPVDKFITSFFVFLVYLQDKWFDIRNINFNITGYAFRTYDPLNIYMENLIIDTHSLRAFSSFKVSWNYPEAVLIGDVIINNITVITSSERPFSEDPSIIYYLGPANITATNIDLLDYYTRAPNSECGLWAVSASNWIPDDGIANVYTFTNASIQLTYNPDGSRYNSFFIVQDQNVYRSIQANIDSLYSPIFETPFNPVIAAFGTTNAIIHITNSIFSSPKLKEDLMLIVLFQQVIISNITINNSLSIGSSLIRSEYIIAFVVKYMQLIDLGISEYTSKPLIFLSNFDFTYTVISNIYLNNWSLSGNQIVQNAAPLNQITIANGYYQGLDLTSPTVLFSTGTIQSVIFQNHTFVNTTWTATDTSSTILSLDNIDLNSTLDSMIAYVSTVGSEISIVKFGTLTNSPPAQRNILFQNIQVSNTNYTTSRSLIDTSNVVSMQNVAITFIGLTFSSISFAVQGQLLQLKHQLASPVVVVNSTFTNLVSSIVNIDSYGSKNASLNTKAQFSNWHFDIINSKYSSLIKTQSNAMAEFGYSNFTNIRTYEQAAVLYAGFEKTSVSFSHCMFANNSAVQGTVFVIESESVVNWANCTFVQNFAITGTVFQTSTNGYFVIADSNIYNNYAINNPVGELLDGANLCVISNSTVYSNQAMSVDTIKSDFNIKCSQLWFVSQDFIQYVNNNALLVPSKYEISLIQLIVSSLSIQSGSKISNEQIMFNIFLSTLTISDSIITNVTNSIQVSSSNMTIQNTQISNVANSAGTDFIFVTLGSIFEMDSSMFSNSSSSLLNARNSQIKISNATISRVNSPSKLVQITSCNSIDMAMLSVVNCTASDLVFFDFDTTTKISLSSFTGSQANSWFVQVQNSNVTTIDAFSIDKVTQPLIVKFNSIIS